MLGEIGGWSRRHATILQPLKYQSKRADVHESIVQFAEETRPSTTSDMGGRYRSIQHVYAPAKASISMDTLSRFRLQQLQKGIAQGQEAGCPSEKDD